MTNLLGSGPAWSVTNLPGSGPAWSVTNLSEFGTSLVSGQAQYSGTSQVIDLDRSDQAVPGDVRSRTNIGVSAPSNGDDQVSARRPVQNCLCTGTGKAATMARTSRDINAAMETGESEAPWPRLRSRCTPRLRLEQELIIRKELLFEEDQLEGLSNLLSLSMIGGTCVRVFRQLPKMARMPVPACSLRPMRRKAPTILGIANLPLAGFERVRPSIRSHRRGSRICVRSS